eukprot:1154358-Pelagomonas_calceolata.AAC.7
MPIFRVNGRLAGSGQEDFQKICTASATASHAPLTLQGYQAVLFGRVAKVSRRGVRWAGQGGRCALYRKPANLGAHAP